MEALPVIKKVKHRKRKPSKLQLQQRLAQQQQQSTRKVEVVVTQYATPRIEEEPSVETDDDGDSLFPGVYVDLDDGEDSREIMAVSFDGVADEQR